MRSLAFYFITIMALTISFQTASAQAEAKAEPRLTSEQRAQKWTDWMTTELQLSAEQQTKAHAINLKYAQQAESIRATGTSRRDKFKDVKSNNNAKDEELKAVLTPTQFEQYKLKKEDMQKKMVKRARQRNG